MCRAPSVLDVASGIGSTAGAGTNPRAASTRGDRARVYTTEGRGEEPRPRDPAPRVYGYPGGVDVGDGVRIGKGRGPVSTFSNPFSRSTTTGRGSRRREAGGFRGAVRGDEARHLRMAHQEGSVHRVQQRQAVAQALLRALAGAHGRNRRAQVLHLGRAPRKTEGDRARPRGVIRAGARRRGIADRPRARQVPRGQARLRVPGHPSQGQGRTRKGQVFLLPGSRKRVRHAQLGHGPLRGYRR